MSDPAAFDAFAAIQHIEAGDWDRFVVQVENAARARSVKLARERAAIIAGSERTAPCQCCGVVGPHPTDDAHVRMDL